ncbi:MAG: hypothetical protein ACLS3M_01940 [Collinsella sp.]
MGHLAEMKIPAKSASSALEDAYVAMVRKQLASVIEARARSRGRRWPRSRPLPPRRQHALPRPRAHRRREGARGGAPPVRRRRGRRGGRRAEAEAKKKAEQERLAREKEAAREAQRRAVPASIPVRAVRCSTRSPHRRPC